jgi:hypothetical protein
MTNEEILEKLNQTPFPEAQNGDNVCFEGHWFLMVENQWVVDVPKTVVIPDNTTPPAR